MKSDGDTKLNRGAARLFSGAVSQLESTTRSGMTPAEFSNDPWLSANWENAIFCGRYEVREQIGAGGMGTVYSAYDRQRSHEIAIKVLSANLLSDAQAHHQFRREAQITSDLNHPNIVNVYDFQQDGDAAFLTMELLNGKTLRQEMRERKKAGRQFAIHEAARIVLQLCDALDYAHHFTVHRDVKPENVWIQPDGNLKLMDFGLAGLVLDRERSRAGLTRSSGMSLGTPYFMAPEQIRGCGNVDARADQYSTAVLLYELLTGEIVAGMASSVRRLRRDVPEALARAVHRALSADPEDRYPSMRTFAAAIRDGGEPLRWLPKSKAGVAVAVGSIAAVAGLLVLLGQHTLSWWRDAKLRREALWAEARTLADSVRAQRRTLAAAEAELLSGSRVGASSIESALDAHGWEQIDQKLRRGLELIEQRKEQLALSALQDADRGLRQIATGLDHLRSFIAGQQKAERSIQLISQLAESGAPSGIGDLSNADQALQQARRALAELRPARAVELVDALNDRLATQETAAAASIRTHAQAAEKSWHAWFRADSIPTLDHLGNAAAFMESAKIAFARQEHGFAAGAYKRAETLFTDWSAEMDALHRRTDEFLRTVAHPLELRTNSLGMWFVRVAPKLWVSIWETRVVDFDVFVRRANEFNHRPDTNCWKNLKITPGPTHPAVGISYADAVNFTQWLFDIDRLTGHLPIEGATYDLCSADDWNEIERALAQRLQQAGITALELQRGVYAGGLKWPPADGYGPHYGDPGLKREDFIRPAASSRPNALGLFEFESNAWEWMVDLYDYGSPGPVDRVRHLNQFMGGGPFGEVRSGTLWLLKPNYIPVGLLEAMGFRVVMRGNFRAD